MNEDEPYTLVLDVADGETALGDLIITLGAYDTSIISDVDLSRSAEQVSLIITPRCRQERRPGGNHRGRWTTGHDEQVSDTFHVTVLPVNDDPVAVDDEGIVTDEDTSVKINVLANDYDTADGDTLTITDAGTPSHGVTSIARAGQIRYTPSAGL